MARIVKPLTFVEIENAKPKEKDYKLIDGYGLFLFISRSGNKVWRFRYKRLLQIKKPILLLVAIHKLV